ncbi:MAG: hypothetical protein DME22_12555 [Verrucomicrobia bacterium]|nr:MAG: hypothetical protein DME22_12555 [Verrucomicrobiota bacterium]PYJ99664.1 MAG: hypothetical protein DME23_09065 [Verrucomicrobiota bacterium]
MANASDVRGFSLPLHFALLIMAISALSRDWTFHIHAHHRAVLQIRSFQLLLRIKPGNQSQQQMKTSNDSRQMPILARR